MRPTNRPASEASAARRRAALRIGTLATGLWVGGLGASGCLEAPLAPTPSAGASLVQFVVACGQWTPTGANCSARGVYADRGERDLTADAAWESSDAVHATVQGGRVTFLTPGIVTITARYSTFVDAVRMSTVQAGRP